MQPYPSEFKEAVLERVLSGEISMNAAAQTYKLAFATVRKWRDDVLAANMPASLTTQGNRMNRLILPKSVSYLKAHEAVVLKHVLGEVEFGKYCRKAGITTEQVNQWQQWFETHPEACNREELTATKEQLRGLVREKAQMSRELEKQKTALSKTATMLLSQKHRLPHLVLTRPFRLHARALRLLNSFV